MNGRVTVFAALILLSGQMPTFGGLVVNGGFETGNFSGWTLNADPTVNFVDSGFTHSGDYAAYLGEPGDIGTLSQSLTTVAGMSYNLSFWFAASGDVPSDFRVAVGGNQLLNLVNPAFDLEYVEYQFNFVAVSTSTLLAFGFRDDDGYLNLDDVSVAAIVPEPSSWTMVASGFFVVLLLRGFSWLRL